MNFIIKTIIRIIILNLIVFYCVMADAECIYNEIKFSERARTCQSGHQFQCEDGTWTDMNVECPDEQKIQSYDSACNCTNDEEHYCNTTEQHCNSTKENGKCISKCIGEK